MLIGVHAKSLSEKYPMGVGEYARRLLQHILAFPEAQKHRFRLYTDANNDLLTRLGSGQRFTNYGSDDGVEIKTLRAPLLWTQARLAWELARHAPNVFFTPQHVLPKTAPKKSVVTIHGLEFERFPQFYAWYDHMYLRWVTKNAVRRAAHIIAVSQATKNDLMELYGVPEEKVTVVYHGTTHDQRPTTNDTIRHLSSVVGPYFLYIGRIEKKKNVDGVVRAFEIARGRYKLPHTLVLAGSDGHGAIEIRSKILNSRFRSNINIAGYVTEEQKWELLRGAAAFIFPSWYEGFGLPILEAQTTGVPVITSNISAMSEVAGLGALYVDPANPESIAEAIQNVTSDAVFRENLIEKGKENCEHFSWEQCARKTLNILCNL